MSQPTSTQKSFRPLPQGAKTRDEIRALVEKHGFLTETQVLEHINKFCKQPWTHEDFVNFFVLSDQMVFQEKNGRLYLAPNRVETSDEGVNDEANSVSTRSQTSQNQSQIDTAGLSRQSDRDVGSIDTEDSSAAESERRRDELPSVGQMPSNYTSDEDSGEGDQPSLTINDVVQMKRARRRHFRAADPEKWVTLDPGKSNRVPTKIRLSSSDSSDDSEG